MHQPRMHAGGLLISLGNNQRGNGWEGLPWWETRRPRYPTALSRADRHGRHTSASGTPTQRQEAGAGNYRPLLEVPTYADTPACVVVLTTTPTDRLTDIRAAFYIMTTAHDYFLSVRSLLIPFTRYDTAFYSSGLFIYYAALLFIWIGRTFGGRLGSKRIWIWIYGLGYGFGWRFRSRDSTGRQGVWVCF